MLLQLSYNHFKYFRGEVGYINPYTRFFKANPACAAKVWQDSFKKPKEKMNLRERVEYFTKEVSNCIYLM